MTRRRRTYDPGPACSVCGFFRINVRHNTTFESQIEGPEYYADVAVHEFVGPESPVGMAAGHPLSARRVKWSETGKRLVTDCWACAVQAEPTNRPGWPSRARATWDNEQVGISDASANRMWPVLSVADTSREDVPRLEVSAP